MIIWRFLKGLLFARGSQIRQLVTNWSLILVRCSHRRLLAICWSHLRLIISRGLITRIFELPWTCLSLRWGYLLWILTTGGTYESWIGLIIILRSLLLLCSIILISLKILRIGASVLSLIYRAALGILTLARVKVLRLTFLFLSIILLVLLLLLFLFEIWICFFFFFLLCCILFFLFIFFFLFSGLLFLFFLSFLHLSISLFHHWINIRFLKLINVFSRIELFLHTPSRLWLSKTILKHTSRLLFDFSLILLRLLRILSEFGLWLIFKILFTTNILFSRDRKRLRSKWFAYSIF